MFDHELQAAAMGGNVPRLIDLGSKLGTPLKEMRARLAGVQRIHKGQADVVGERYGLVHAEVLAQQVLKCLFHRLP